MESSRHFSSQGWLNFCLIVSGMGLIALSFEFATVAGEVVAAGAGATPDRVSFQKGKNFPHHMTVNASIKPKALGSENGHEVSNKVEGKAETDTAKRSKRSQGHSSGGAEGGSKVATGKFSGARKSKRQTSQIDARTTKRNSELFPRGVEKEIDTQGFKAHFTGYVDASGNVIGGHSATKGPAEASGKSKFPPGIDAKDVKKLAFDTIKSKGEGSGFVKPWIQDQNKYILKTDCTILNESAKIKIVIGPNPNNNNQKFKLTTVYLTKAKK